MVITCALRRAHRYKTVADWEPTDKRPLERLPHAAIMTSDTVASTGRRIYTDTHARFKRYKVVPDWVEDRRIDKPFPSTRMHSSGMRTVRSSSRLSRGVSASEHAGIPSPLGADTPRTIHPLETCCKTCWDTTCNACWDTTPRGHTPVKT